MKFVPEWATGLPLDSELGYAKTYGNCDDNVDEVTAMCTAAYNEEIA
jgi:pyruvate-formate lyase